MTSEIYALTDPRDGAVRYIGKANSSAARFKGHMREARRSRTPVYDWIRKLHRLGMVPGLSILEVAVDWQEAERRLIAFHRVNGARLLNVAEGGEQPSCSVEVRASNGRANAASRHPRKWKLLQALGVGLKRGHVSEETKRLMRSRPDVFGQLSQFLTVEG